MDSHSPQGSLATVSVLRMSCGLKSLFRGQGGEVVSKPPSLCGSALPTPTFGLDPSPRPGSGPQPQQNTLCRTWGHMGYDISGLIPAPCWSPHSPVPGATPPGPVPPPPHTRVTCPLSSPPHQDLPPPSSPPQPISGSETWLVQSGQSLLPWAILAFFFFFFFFFSFLGLHQKYMEVPRLGVELELQLPADTTATATRDP